MTAWGGVLYVGTGWMVYRGPLGATGFHAHHAVQAIHATEPFTLTDIHGARTDATKAVIPADRPHRLDAQGQAATITYLDPAGTIRALDHADQWAKAGAALPETSVELLSDARHLASLVAATCGAQRPTSADQLATDAMAAARRRLPHRVLLGDVASSIGSSPSRLTHRFSAAVGIPFSRWVLWERLQLAGTAVAAGASLTAAAHTAGFADSAHLNRTFRRMFGVAPSDIAGAVTWHVDH